MEEIFSEEEKKFWDFQIIIILHLCNNTLLFGKFQIIICWQCNINYNNKKVTKFRGDLQ